MYKARLKGTGETVAVKVQRPYVLATVTRDLYVIRMVLGLLGYVHLPYISTDMFSAMKGGRKMGEFVRIRVRS